MRTIVLLTTLAAATFALVGCVSRAELDQQRAVVRDGSLMHKELRSYHVVYSEHRGKVGYLKEYDVREAGQAMVRQKYVYDLDFRQVGLVDHFGNAYRYHYYSQDEEVRFNTPFRVDRLTRDAIQQNVMRMLDINPAEDDVSFPVATDADIREPVPQTTGGTATAGGTRSEDDSDSDE